MNNNSDKSFDSFQEFQCKGLKVIKPDKLPLKFAMKPRSEMIYGFFVSPAGFEYSNTEKIKY